MNWSRVRTVAKRSAQAGVVVAVGIAAFPKFEDWYWHKVDPGRVIESSESKESRGSTKEKQKLVILGTGWASISALKHIDRDKYEIKVISPRNYFLFTPLLPSVCVGTVTQEAVTVPIREVTSYKALSVVDRIGFMIRGYLPNRVEYIYAAATDIDPTSQTIKCVSPGSNSSEESCYKSDKKSFTIPYDQLIIGTGATTNTFNTKGVEENCFFLKQTGDASLIRHAVLENLEKASLPHTSEEERKRLLTFVTVGGGPTGLEAAAELQDFLVHDVVNPIKAQYNRCYGYTSVSIVQSNKHLLPGYPEQVQKFSEKHLKQIGVGVITESRVTEVGKEMIHIMDKKTKQVNKLPYGLCIWATGVSPGKLAETLIKKLPEQVNFRCLTVDSRLNVVGTKNIWAVGDCSDIDVEPEYVNHVLKLFRKLAGSESKQLGREANAKFVYELKDHFGDDFHGITKAFGYKIQDKIVQDLTFMYEKATEEASVSGVKFKGIAEDKAIEIVKKHLRRQKHLPPTAQVAHQQGEWIAKLLNEPKIDEETGEYKYKYEAFGYHDLGSLVYVGNHVAAISVPATNDVKVSWNGTFTNYIWHAAYFGMLESTSARTELLFDWTKRSFFGRSTALSEIASTDDSDSEAEAMRPKGMQKTRKRDQIKKAGGYLSSIFFRKGD